MATEPSKVTRRKRRWGDGPTENNTVEAAENDESADNNNGESSKRKSRFSKSPPPSANGGGSAPPPAAPADPKARAAALQASIQARLAALKARTAPKPTSAATSTTSAAAPKPKTTTQKRTLPNKNDKPSNKKAKVFELDMTTTAPTRLLEKQQREEQLRIDAQPKEEVNPYLAHTVAATALDNTTTTKPSTETNDISKSSNAQPEEEILDTRLAASTKNRLKSRPINFVTPGTYIALGEKKREQAALAGKSGYLSGRKVGNVVKSVGMGGGLGVPLDIEIGGDGAVDGGFNKGGGGMSHYGSSQAGKVITFPARIDAPELELEDYVPKKKILTSISDVQAEKNNGAISAALVAAEKSMPYAMEWWDAELLPSKLRKELAGEEGRAIASRAKKQVASGLSSKTNDKQGTETNDNDSIAKQYQTQKSHHSNLIAKCYKHASLTHSRTHTLLQHPIPILTPAQKAAKIALANKPSTLHLTKAERKRHRKLRRAERLREQQDLQAAGLVAPPEPRLTLSNYMKVLGDQAILDPSKMEAVVMSQIQSRKLKHEQMNADRKLTKEQKSAKHVRKLQEDTSQSITVALFYVKDMSHRYHRAKVDLNAQQNGITGGVLELCEEDGVEDDGSEGRSGMALVVAEGGEKAIKRYIRLMTVRMRWKGEDFYEEEEEEEELMVGEDEEAEGEGKKEKRKKFNPNNECDLIWTGMAVKRAFHSFMFQSASNSTVARKILEAKGVAHYWDLAVGHVERKEGVVGGVALDGYGDGALRFRLGDNGGGKAGDDDMEM